MKKLILMAAMLFVGAKAEASVETDVFRSSCTSYNALVSSSVANNGATQVFPTGLDLTGLTTGFPLLQSGRVSLELQNISMTTFTYVFCEISKSSASAATGLSFPTGDFSLVPPPGLTTQKGRMIPPQGGAWKINLQGKDSFDRAFIPWCVNNGGVGQSSMTVTQCK